MSNFHKYFCYLSLPEKVWFRKDIIHWKLFVVLRLLADSTVNMFNVYFKNIFI